MIDMTRRACASGRTCRVHVQTGATLLQARLRRDAQLRRLGHDPASSGRPTASSARCSASRWAAASRFALTDPAAKFQLAVVATADGLFNYYFNTLYLRTRLAGYGTIGIEADFE